MIEQPKNLNPVEVSLPVNEQDVTATLEGLKPGWYSARDLYERYLTVTNQAGRAPGHPTAFGQALKRRGLLRKKMLRAGRQVHGWIL